MLAVWPLAAAPAITLILGQPTDRSITVNARADAAVELYFEFGVTSGVYSAQTKSAVAAADPYAPGFFISQTVLTGLSPDTRYFYRIESRAAGSSGPFTPGAEYSFHTERRPGSSFTFCVQGDSHPERASMFNAGLYTQTLAAVASERPDFYVASGDDFSVDTLPTPYTQSAVTGRYTLQLPYLGLVGRTAPLFLVTGNHEETSLSNYNLPADSANSNMVPVWAQNAHNLYYPSPAPGDPNTGTFYTGNVTNVPGIGLLRDYYAWQWGDALFVVIDPYWTSPAQVDTGLGGQNGAGGKTADKWSMTHGDAQYLWLKQTLEQSTAKWKFVFAHHVMGTGRGGIEIANQYEWGGVNSNGTSGLAAKRPTWPASIHDLFVANRVNIFFQGHDHLYAHQQLDGVTYQELPNPADNTYTAFNADAYTSGDIFPNSGYVKVTVSAAAVKVEYIREFLPQDENPPSRVSGAVQFAYTIAPSAAAPAPAVSRVADAAGQGPNISPNSWVEIDGLNLAPRGDSFSGQGSNLAYSDLPAQMGGVSASVNGKAAFLKYVSPTQLIVLPPSDAMSGPVSVRVTVNGSASPAFTAQAQALSPSFFVFGGGLYVVATHADGGVVGPAGLVPGVNSPAKPGEAIALYAGGFGSTSGTGVPSSLPKLPDIKIGGTAATVQSAGLIAAGLFQFNIVVPSGAPDGDLPIVASYNGASTQSGTLLTVRH